MAGGLCIRNVHEYSEITPDSSKHDMASEKGREMVGEKWHTRAPPVKYSVIGGGGKFIRGG